MKYLVIFLLTIGLFSCSENKSTDTYKETKTEVKINSTINDFDLLDNFLANKRKFSTDTFEMLEYSANGGELIVYHNNEHDYIVLDFLLYGETGKLNYTYWTDRNFKIKFVKTVDYIYDKPFYEEDFKIDSVTKYITFSHTNHRLFDSNKNEITNKELIDSTKLVLENFYKEKTLGIEILK